MRKFIVYLDKRVARSEPVEEILEFSDDTTEEEIDEACQECLDVMITNELYTGWDEIK